MDLERELLGVFGGHEVLMANGQRELVLGLEISESVGIGVCRSACFSIEIVCEYVDELLPVIIVVGTRGIIARVVSTIADRTEIDRRTMKTPIGNMLGGTEQAVSNAFGKVAAYYIYFLAILAAADALQIPLLSQWIADAASYLPAFIAGLLIIVVGFIVADFVGNAIERSASSTGSRVGLLLASGVQVFLYFIVIVVGLDTMQVDVEILYIFASAVAGGLGLAIGLGIALGLGGRDYVAENIDDWAGKASTEMDSSDTRPETHGSGSSASGTDPDIGD